MAEHGAPRGEDAEGNTDDRRRQHGGGDEQQMIEAERRELAGEPRALVGVAHLPAEEARRDLPDAAAVEIGQRVQARHRRGVDPTDQRPLQCGPRPRVALHEIDPCQQDGGVGGKEPAVVAQHREARSRQPAVGREDVREVGRAAGEGLVGQRVLDHADGQPHAVVATQAGPAVVALEEARAEHRPQLRMAREVADAREPQASGEVVTHGQGVGVVEAERRADGQALRPQPGPDGLDRVGRRVLEDRAADGARVLRIEVDAAVADRPVGDTGAAQAQPALDDLARRLDRLRRDLGQDVVLGERLRADLHDGGGGQRRYQDHQEQQGAGAVHPRSTRAARRAAPARGGSR